MTTPNILVVDSDEGFGNMLKGGLNSSGYYQAECVHSGRAAVMFLKATPCDLVIIDMALDDVSPIKLVRAIRKAKPKLRVMLIPLMGQTLPEKVTTALEINGILTKPFFVGDLPDVVNKALGIEASQLTSVPVKPASQAPTSTETKNEQTSDTPSTSASESSEPQPDVPPQVALPSIPQETVSFLRANESEILRLLGDLNREVRAEAIMLVAGQELIANAGLLSREKCRELTLLIAQSSQAAAQAAQYLGETAGRFTQSLHEGKDYRVFTLTLREGVLLSLALSSNVPLGMIRHQARLIAQQIEGYM